VGIQYVLCNKLRQFTYEELEFFLPQLCHLLISVDNESMALEEFILDLCEESVNSALLVRLSGQVATSQSTAGIAEADNVALTDFLAVSNLPP
jgi:hypothetical protein